jgi:hypothetical protein
LLIRPGIGLPGWVVLATLAFGVDVLRLRAAPIACTRTSAVFVDHDDSFQSCRQIVLLPPTWRCSFPRRATL